MNNTGNTQLIEYGIQTEDSDYRVHVGYKTQRVYVFPTEDGRQAIIQREIDEARKVSADGDIVTATGYAIPIDEIDNMRSILIPDDVYNKYAIHPKARTTTKGIIATKIVSEMLKRQLIPLPMKVDVASDDALQISGTDIIIKANLKLQIKCDYNAGLRKYGGTGNVFLQTHECNPYRQY